MQDDLFWQLFADTGDPLGYLYYRAAQNALAQTTDELSLIHISEPTRH